MIISLHIGLSYKCNMACAHCFVSKDKDKLKISDILGLVNSLKDKGLFVIYYTFGEPMVHEMLEPLLFELNRMNMVHIVMSNGYAIDEKTAEMLKTANVSRVFVSLDHYLPEKHDQNRGVSGAFSHALRAIEVLREKKINTGIATTVTKENESVLEEICNLAEREGVNVISFLRERKNGLIEEDGYDDYYDFVKRNIVSKDENLTIQLHDPSLKPLIETLYKNGEIDDIQYERWYTMNSCHYYSTLAVAPNGDIMHCHLSQKVIGNILRDNVLEVIDKEVSVYECPVCCAKFSG